MERKDLLLNNDLSMMLSREQNPEPDFGKEWEEEQKALRQEADDVVNNPNGSIDAKLLMEQSARYAGTEDYYLNLFTEGSDDKQLAELRSLEYAASMTLLPDALLIAGEELADKEDYGTWNELLYALYYVPLQKTFCYCLTRHKDFIGVLNVLNIQRLEFPQTFLWSLLDHWFEWLTRIGGHLLTYSDEKGFYDKNKKAQELKAEALVIKEEWERTMPAMIHEIMEWFSKYIQPSKLLEWATKEPLRDDAQSNQFSANYNKCLGLICDDLSQVVDLNIILQKELNLNMLMLMANKAIGDMDVDFGKEVYGRLPKVLLNENFSNMEKKSELDEKRQRIIAQLIVLVDPALDFKQCVNDVATRFQGWNLDYQQVYEEARREAYMICGLFRVFEVQVFEEVTRFTLWKKLVDIYVWEYKRCENEYILRDEYAVPFRVAVEVAERLQDENCRKYLHEIILENVLSIVTLLTIFSECSMNLSVKTIEHLVQRTDNEWPSAKMLMEVRGQRMLESRIENLIGQLRAYIKK